MKLQIPTRFLSIALLICFKANTPAAAQNSVFISSPNYHVDISLNFTGQCDPYEGAVFSQYSAISQFNSVKFVASQTKEHPCWILQGGGVPFINIEGEGRFVSFRICPHYDPEPQPARITYGPSFFNPTLKVLSKEELIDYIESENPEVMPLATSVWFKYSDSFSIAQPELEWNTNIGSGCAETRQVVFHVPLEALGKGEIIETTVPYNYIGESGTWNILFTPE